MPGAGGFGHPEHDTAVKINWLSFNVPTLVMMFGALWYFANDRAETRGDIEELRIIIEANKDAVAAQVEALKTATQAWQLSMDRSRELTRTEYDKKLGPILDNNIPFRMTTLETVVERNKQSVDERIDRIGGALNTVREASAETNTKLALQDQKIESIIETLNRAFPVDLPSRGGQARSRLPGR
jgi:hypothetical protein